MERFFEDPKTTQKFRTGPLGLHIQQLADELSEHGYTRLSGRVRIRTLSRFGRWLNKCSIPVQDLTSAHVTTYVERYGSVKCGDKKVLLMLLDLLSRKGLLARPVQFHAYTEAESIVAKFSNYLRQQRALASGTIRYHSQYLAMFLAFRFSDGPIDLSKIEAKDFIIFVQKEAARRTPMSAKNVTTVLRSFAVYLFSAGIIDRDLSVSVPTVCCRSLTGIPKGLTREQAARVLTCCDRKTVTGRRDYAVLLLLARLGLRAGEVAALRLEDIDWTAGTVTVLGKGAKVSKLPLPHDVGQAIAASLSRDRPSVSSKNVFLRISAPHRGFQGSRSVCQIVRNALARAGVESRSKGAHQFRNTLASQMLANGASLPDIGRILRHENPKTTFLYAKVDLQALRPIAKSWPGGVR